MPLERFEIDPAHSVVEFLVQHLVVSRVRGMFTRFRGSLLLDDEDLGKSSVEACVETASVNTNERDRDAHLRSPDFFDTERFPEMCFTSAHVDVLGDRHLAVVGELTMHGVTREIVLDTTYGGRVRDPWDGERVGFEATATLDRRDFGLVWNAALDAGNVLVGNTVEIDIEVEAVRVGRPEPAAAVRLP